MKSSSIYTQLRMCHSGDINDIRTVILEGIDTLANVASAETHLYRNGVTATLATQVVNATERSISINLGVDPTDWLPSGPDVGEWIGQIEIVFNDGTELTWPSVGNNQGFFSINVVRQLG